MSRASAIERARRSSFVPNRVEPGAARGQGLAQRGPLAAAAGEAGVNVDPFHRHTGREQHVALRLGVLLVRRDSCVSDQLSDSTSVLFEALPTEHFVGRV